MIYNTTPSFNRNKYIVNEKLFQYITLMTDEELDTLFIETLKAILEDTKECADYSKNIHTPEYEEINEDYQFTINQISQLLDECSSIDDLAQMDEETIDDVYEYIATYADNFVISAEEPERIENLAQYSKLEELLGLFLDDDYEDDEE